MVEFCVCEARVGVSLTRVARDNLGSMKIVDSIMQLCMYMLNNVFGTIKGSKYERN